VTDANVLDAWLATLRGSLRTKRPNARSVAAAPGRPASRSGQFGPGRRLAPPRRQRGKPHAAARSLPGNASQRGAASTLVVEESA